MNELVYSLAGKGQLVYQIVLLMGRLGFLSNLKLVFVFIDNITDNITQIAAHYLQSYQISSLVTQDDKAASTSLDLNKFAQICLSIALAAPIRLIKMY